MTLLGRWNIWRACLDLYDNKKLCISRGDDLCVLGHIPGLTKEVTMRTLSRWYEREHRPYAVDRQIIEGYAHWLKQVHWRLFCTFTFAWKVSDQQANKTFDEFINRLECHLKCDVGYVRGDEKRFSGCGKPACARHFHVLLTSTAPVIPETVELLWMSMAGKRADHAGAQVQPYNRNSSGASYVMKLTNQPDGNWESRKLHLFHPSARVEKITKRMRRHLHRHPLLAQQFMKDQAIGHK